MCVSLSVSVCSKLCCEIILLKETMTIYDIPSLVRDAWPKAAVPSNIINGFKATGVFPFNRDIFTDAEFQPSATTDRPLEKSVESSDNPNLITTHATTQNQNDETPETSYYPQYPSTNVMANPLVDTLQYLMQKGITGKKVHGDGHCLLYALQESLKAEHVTVISSENLCTKLILEVGSHLDYYKQFSDMGTDVMKDLKNYVTQKQYNADTIDLVLVALVCNSLNIEAMIYQQRNALVHEMKLPLSRPSSSSNGMVHLILTGTYHYVRA